MAYNSEIMEQKDVQALRDMAADSFWQPFKSVAEGRTPEGVLIYVDGKGCRVTDVEGKSYFDLFSGLMFKQVGHGRKEIADAAYAQMLKLSSTVQYDTASVPAIKLAAKLKQITPGSLSRTAFLNGGSEAVETAVKTAKHYQRLCGFGGRFKIIARQGEYHGFTHMAMALGKAGLGYWSPFEPLGVGIRHMSHPYCYRCPLSKEYPACDLACAKELERLLLAEDPNLVAGVVITPISQQTPIAVPPPDYFPTIQSICKKYGVLLIDDEVVCGFGRTGKMFGLEQWNVVPDIMAMAKGITSGYLPLGACITTSEISDKFEESRDVFRNVSTFGGLPACCAAALANIDIIEKENLLENAVSMGEYLSDRLQSLREHPMVGDIRGVGLMWGIELVKNRKTKERLTRAEGKNLNVKLRDAGIITRTSDDTIRLLPPLSVTKDEMDQCIAIIDKVIGQLETEMI